MKHGTGRATLLTPPAPVGVHAVQRCRVLRGIPATTRAANARHASSAVVAIDRSSLVNADTGRVWCSANSSLLFQRGHHKQSNPPPLLQYSTVQHSITSTGNMIGERTLNYKHSITPLHLMTGREGININNQLISIEFLLEDTARGKSSAVIKKKL